MGGYDFPGSNSSIDMHALTAIIYSLAVLRIIIIFTFPAPQGKRLLLVKNPWTHLRWKGRYSEKDLSSWTPELRKALDYNPADAQQFDDGESHSVCLLCVLKK
ncbi:unnamed protein product [Gongylonema pulchrum]|uniref:Calpain catalytic domain-containing protein n=1 Tax=Gongylonema pulchrum TaxID=637853 RepID=A0A183D818_9BILA|nr:unnamed protein product [Gongylonema pulchrum]